MSHKAWMQPMAKTLKNINLDDFPGATKSNRMDAIVTALNISNIPTDTSIIEREKIEIELYLRLLRDSKVENVAGILMDKIKLSFDRITFAAEGKGYLDGKRCAK